MNYLKFSIYTKLDSEISDLIIGLLERGIPADHISDECERITILNLLKINEGNQTKTAKDLKMARHTLRTKLKRYGVI